MFWWLALLVACGGDQSRPTPSSGATPATDDLGQPIRLSGTPRRIVSLAPATTELLFAIGAGDRLVGRTRWCDYPPEVASIPSVGDGLSPNIEVVAAQRPDLVVMYASSSNLTAVEQFGRLGIAAVNVRFDALSDVPRAARLLGRILGDTARADSLAARFETALDSARRAPREVKFDAAVITWIDPPNVIGGGSFLTEVIALAGGRNVFTDVRTPSATVSIETIAARNPQAILVLDSNATRDVTRRTEWRAVRAVRDRRFVPIIGTEFSRPSFRVFDAVAELAAAFAQAAR